MEACLSSCERLAVLWSGHSRHLVDAYTSGVLSQQLTLFRDMSLSFYTSQEKSAKTKT